MQAIDASINLTAFVRVTDLLGEKKKNKQNGRRQRI